MCRCIHNCCPCTQMQRRCWHNTHSHSAAKVDFTVLVLVSGSDNTLAWMNPIISAIGCGITQSVEQVPMCSVLKESEVKSRQGCHLLADCRSLLNLSVSPRWDWDLLGMYLLPLPYCMRAGHHSSRPPQHSSARDAFCILPRSSAELCNVPLHCRWAPE